MTQISVSIEYQSAQVLRAEINAPLHFPLQRRVSEGLVIGELAMMESRRPQSVMLDWDFHETKRVSENERSKNIMVVFHRHDPKTDLFQRRADGSLAMTVESLQALGKKK